MSDVKIEDKVADEAPENASAEEEGNDEVRAGRSKMQGTSGLLAYEMLTDGIRRRYPR